MKLLVFTRYDTLGASSRVRCYQYLASLKAAEIEVITLPLFDNEYIENLYAGRAKNKSLIIANYCRRLITLYKSKQFDLLWIEKELFPWLPAFAEILLAKCGIPYVVDYDDAIFHYYDTHQNFVVHKLLARKIDQVMRHAVLVMAGNDYIAERAVKAGAKRVEILPTVVDLQRYQSKANNQNKLYSNKLNFQGVKPVHLRGDEGNDVESSSAKSIFTIGWIGTPSTAKYLQLILPVLKRLYLQYPVRIILVGLNNFTVSDLPVEGRFWSEETEVADIQTFDVGVMPLNDDQWERGKCGYKLIQYMACGKPVIASPVGVNCKIVEPHINGFLANNEEEWFRAFATLYENKKLCEQLGRAGRVKIEKEYCLQITAPRLIELLKDCARNK